jgi:predicted nucleotide-binding protein (sugar kinase/HSP70/actin superfamily)
MMIDAVQRIVRRGNCNPLCSIILDEHSAEAGIVTRLEAFVDTLHRRRSTTFVPNAPAEVPAEAQPKFGRNMKLAFPHMGTVHVALEVLFGCLGIEIVVPPPCSKRSLDLASKYSPEWACVPYKLTLGNFIEALEAGANSLILLRGPNNCRFGYYNKLQDQVLRDLGYEFQWVLPEINGRSINGIAEVLRDASGRSVKECWSAAMLALDVQRNIDAIERKVQLIRARELKKGSAEAIWEEALERVATIRDKKSLKSLRRKYEAMLDAVPIDPNHDPVRVCIVGEIYVVQEPYINQDIEVQLGKLGVEVHRSEQVSQWLSVFPGAILDWLGIGHNARIQRAERPYFKHWSGETVGQTVMADEDGYDGVIQLAPFTCTPEVVAQNVLPKLRRDVDIPVLTVILDEQTARTGLITRLEAFVDLLQRRRRTHRRRSKSWLARHLPLPNNPLSLSKGRG